MKQIVQAAEASKRAYAPYSRYQVGCVIVTASGKEFTGCNVENACYPAGMCAERVAIGQAVASGERAIKEVYLVVNSDKPAVPCGMCLQVMSEFGSDIEIITASEDQKTVHKYKFKDLLPHAFDKNYLNATV
jgi:cytidine deaminase